MSGAARTEGLGVGSRRRGLSHQPGGWTRASGGRSSEDGITLVLGALLLTSLLLISAVVVDIGNVYAHRRTDQSAADSGALAAAQDLAVEATAVAEAKAVVHDNLGVVLTNAEWNSCGSDPDRLAITPEGSNCISFNNSRSRIRVRVPDQYVDTGFSSVVGIDEVRHAAFATAAVTQRGFGGVLPFGMPSGAGSGDGYACIKSNSGGLADAPCNGPDSGNFGTLDLGLFGNEDLGTTNNCGSGGTRDRIANNIAVGSDHDLEVYVSGEPLRVDTEQCNPPVPGPNAAYPQTGNNQGPVGSGMFSGAGFSDGERARLQRTDPGLFNGGGATRLVNGHEVDDNPLWLFIPPTLTSNSSPSGQIPKSCERNQFVDGSDAPTLANLPAEIKAHVQGLSVADRMLLLMQRCMTHYRGEYWGGGAVNGKPAFDTPEPRIGCGGSGSSAPCTAPVFALDSSSSDAPDLFDIQYTPRFAYVPELDGPFESGSSTPVKFAKFRPVFMQRLTIGNGKNATRYDPGVDDPAPPASPGQTDVREITLWVFPDNMLPGELDEDDAPYAIGVNRFVQLVS